MGKKSLLIAAVLVFLLIATAMAVENKNANENFTSQEYLYYKSFESATDAVGSVNSANAEGYLLQNHSDRRISTFSVLQPFIE